MKRLLFHIAALATLLACEDASLNARQSRPSNDDGENPGFEVESIVNVKAG